MCVLLFASVPEAPAIVASRVRSAREVLKGDRRAASIAIAGWEPTVILGRHLAKSALY
jgi:hypothetical protein